MQKIKILLTGALILSFTLLGFAQDLPKGFKYNNNFDLAFAFGGGQVTISPSWAHLHGIGKKEKFKIGYGVRFNSVFGSDQIFTTVWPVTVSL